MKELVEPFAMTEAAISKHLKVLERADLISGNRDTQRRPSRLVAKPAGRSQPMAGAISPVLGDFLPPPGWLLSEFESPSEKKENTQ